jgi:hypothetical protein
LHAEYSAPLRAYFSSFKQLSFSPVALFALPDLGWAAQHGQSAFLVPISLLKVKQRAPYMRGLNLEIDFLPSRSSLQLLPP